MFFLSERVRRHLRSLKYPKNPCGALFLRVRVNCLLTVTFNDVGHKKNILRHKVQNPKMLCQYCSNIKLGLIEATAHSNFTKQIEQVASQIRHVLLLIALCLCIYSI